QGGTQAEAEAARVRRGEITPRAVERGEAPVERILVDDDRVFVQHLAETARGPREADRGLARLPDRRLLPRGLARTMVSGHTRDPMGDGVTIRATTHRLREQRQGGRGGGGDRDVARVAAHRVSGEEGIDAEMDDGRV